jgi:hypothetical protein
MNQGKEIIDARLTEVANQIQQNLAATRNAIAPVIRDFQKVSNRIATQLTSFQPIVHKALKRAAINTHRILSALDDIDFQAIYERDLKYGMWLLDEAGWPPLMHAPVGFALRLQKNTGQDLTKDQVRQIDRAIVRYHSSDLLRNSVLRNWERKPFLKKRIRILGKVIRAHIAGDYELSIPALIPQVEGLIAEYFGHRSRLNQRQLKNYIQRALKDSDRRWGDASGEIYALFLINRMLSDFDWGEKPRTEESRHAILHGNDTNYATAKNSLKMILVLDFLIMRIRAVKCCRSKIFHFHDCAALRRVGPEDRVFLSFYEVKDQKLRPCKLCVKSEDALANMI